MHVIKYLGKDSGLLTYFSTFPSSCAALSRHCSSKRGEEQDKIKSIVSYIALSHQFTLDINNAVSSCYWIWVKLKQMTLHPLVSNELTFLEHLKTPLGRELSCCSLAHLIFLSPHPNGSVLFPGLSQGIGEVGFHGH